MEIWCDESGGINVGLFVVAAIAGEPKHVAAVLRRIKKVAGISGELHSCHLTVRQIRQIANELSKHPEIAAASVFESKPSTLPLAMTEAELWGHLITESSLVLHNQNIRCIVSDRPRYKKAISHKIFDKVATDIAFRSGYRQVEIYWEDSQRSPGIQLADFVSNLVWRSLQSGPYVDVCRHLLKETNPGIVIRPLRSFEPVSSE